MRALGQRAIAASSRQPVDRHFFCLARPLLQKILRICELPRIGAAKKCASPYRQAQRRGDANARMDGGNRRRGRDWSDLVVRRDVQLDTRGRLGNDIAAC